MSMGRSDSTLANIVRLCSFIVSNHLMESIDSTLTQSWNHAGWILAEKAKDLGDST